MWSAGFTERLGVNMGKRVFVWFVTQATDEVGVPLRTHRRRNDLGVEDDFKFWHVNLLVLMEKPEDV